MLIQQAFQYQLKENWPTHVKVRQFVGCRRFVFNKALAFQIQNHADSRKYLRYETMAGYLTTWRNDPQTAWPKNALYDCLQQALKDLHKTDINFFDKRAEFPKFKKIGKSGDAFRFSGPSQIKLDATNNQMASGTEFAMPVLASAVAFTLPTNIAACCVTSAVVFLWRAS